MFSLDNQIHKYLNNNIEDKYLYMQVPLLVKIVNMFQRDIIKHTGN